MPEAPRQEDVDALLKALGVSPAPAPAPLPTAAKGSSPGDEASKAAGPVPLEPLTPASGPRDESGIDLLNDVNVQVRIELGSARLSVQDVLKLGAGSVVGLESTVSEPVNVFVNDRLVARGEVLVVNDNFAVRITEVLPLPKDEGKPLGNQRV